MTDKQMFDPIADFSKNTSDEADN